MAQFQSDYAEALAAHLDRGTETTLLRGYELGREGIAQGLGILDIVEVHHGVLSAAVEQRSAAAVTRSAGAFLVEVLSPFEMVRRGYQEACDGVALERWRHRVLQRLSNVLADASLTAPTPDVLHEALQLVAEQVLELTRAASCTVRTLRPSVLSPWVITACAHHTDDGIASEVHVEPLKTLAGEDVGVLEITPRRGVHLTGTDLLLAAHVAELTSAALERTELYAQAPGR